MAGAEELLLASRIHGFKTTDDLTVHKVRSAASHGRMDDSVYLAILYNLRHFSEFFVEELPHVEERGQGIRDRIFLCPEGIEDDGPWILDEIHNIQMDGVTYMEMKISYSPHLERREYSLLSRCPRKIVQYDFLRDPIRRERARAKQNLDEASSAADELL